MIYNSLIALAGWIAYNAILLRIDKDKYDETDHPFPLKAYALKSIDNWIASFCIIPVLLIIGHYKFNIPDFGYGEVAWSDLYYLCSGFATEVVIYIYFKLKKKFSTDK